MFDRCFSCIRIPGPNLLVSVEVCLGPCKDPCSISNLDFGCLGAVGLRGLGLGWQLAGGRVGDLAGAVWFFAFSFFDGLPFCSPLVYLFFYPSLFSYPPTFLGSSQRDLVFLSLRPQESLGPLWAPPEMSRKPHLIGFYADQSMEERTSLGVLGRGPSVTEETQKFWGYLSCPFFPGILFSRKPLETRGG